MWEALAIIANLVILESLLSIDNAAVLALMVKDLPGDQSKKALRYGMWGAYIARGLCLLFAWALVGVWWIKIIGGIFLLRLFYTHFTKKNDSPEEATKAEDSGVYNWVRKKLGLSVFWSTIILVEWMDIVFSVDNVLAAAALSKSFWVIFVGVCIGITVMRFVAGFFLNLMRKYPSLEVSAYIVIGILGLKLCVEGLADWLHTKYSFWGRTYAILEDHKTALILSGCMMLIFFIPIITSLFRGERMDKDPDSYLT